MNEPTCLLHRCLLLAALVLCAACAVSGDGNRWSRHGDSRVWAAAAAAQFEHPAQSCPS